MTIERDNPHRIDFEAVRRPGPGAERLAAGLRAEIYPGGRV